MGKGARNRAIRKLVDGDRARARALRRHGREPLTTGLHERLDWTRGMGMFSRGRR